MFTDRQYAAFLAIFQRSKAWADEESVHFVIDAYWYSYLAPTFKKRGLDESQLEAAGEILLERFQSYEGKGNPIAYLMSLRDRVAQLILEMTPLPRQRPSFSMETLFENCDHQRSPLGLPGDGESQPGQEAIGH